MAGELEPATDCNPVSMVFDPLVVTDPTLWLIEAEFVLVDDQENCVVELGTPSRPLVCGFGDA